MKENNNTATHTESKIAKRMKVRAEQEKYPVGSRIKITRLNGVDLGIYGTVLLVDGLGVIKVQCDNDDKVRVIPGIDTFRSLTDAEIQIDTARKA